MAPRRWLTCICLTQRSFKPASCSVQPDKEAGCGTSHYLRGLPRGEVVPRDEGEQLAVGIRQGRESGKYRKSLGDLIGYVGCRGRLGCPPLKFCNGLPTGGSAKLTEHHIPGDGQQPRQGRRRNIAEPPPGDQKHLAGDLFS